MEWKRLQVDMTHKHKQQHGFPVVQLSDDNTLNLINLPDVVLETILSNLTYDEISKNRIVCKQFDRICKKLLNRGFNLMEKYHAQCLRAVKSKLPRRESERRSHPLARHCDILTAIETRISMLSMTFSKYVETNVCCFIPGKVIDEIFRVLRLIRDTKTPPRAHEILQELRDISSMAMEHFDEKILPDLKHNICMVGTVNSYELPGGALMISHTRHPNNATLPHNFTSEKLNQSFKKIYDRTKQNKISCLTMRNLMRGMKLRMKRQGFQLRLQSLKLQKQAKKLHEQDTQLAEMRKHLEEWEQKMVDLTAELSRAREGTQNPDSLESRKHMAISKHIINTEVDTTLQTNELHSKKRKLIVERKSSSDAQDIKFKKFMSDLLANNTLDSSFPSTSNSSTFLH
ncbi:F-box only protein 28 [Harpegnathos saltator]|uniref:F-box only protein 28 n=1 Tax=Harpegnathos saltator TaxID=610380 RepID=E2BU52_HARSA|nr:F-box only protein 28 [Harpegnathos saltator]EFN80769.1 F-box only protein 28 [Harpegnathos saltator]